MAITVHKEKQAAHQFFNYLLSFVDFDSLDKENLALYNLSAPYFEQIFGLTEYKTLENKHYLILQAISENIVEAQQIATYIEHSAPATYPLMNALVTRQYIIVEHNTSTKKKNYRLTPYGREKLIEWQKKQSVALTKE